MIDVACSLHAGQRRLPLDGQVMPDETPIVRYARSGDLTIAYQVLGDGPFDLVWVPG
jgi:hypothetical protein